MQAEPKRSHLGREVPGQFSTLVLDGVGLLWALWANVSQGLAQNEVGWHGQENNPWSSITVQIIIWGLFLKAIACKFTVCEAGFVVFDRPE